MSTPGLTKYGHACPQPGSDFVSCRCSVRSRSASMTVCRPVLRQAARMRSLSAAETFEIAWKITPMSWRRTSYGISAIVPSTRIPS